MVDSASCVSTLSSMLVSSSTPFMPSELVSALLPSTLSSMDSDRMVLSSALPLMGVLLCGADPRVRR